MEHKFKVGEAYFANPTIPGNRQRIVACTGRKGRTAVFARVDLMKRCEVETIDGREFAMIRADNGIDYAVSAATQIDMADLTTVLACIN